MERRSRSRSRSPSPNGRNRTFRDNARTRGGEDGDTDKERLERERRERMARLRAENDAEEKGTPSVALEYEDDRKRLLQGAGRGGEGASPATKKNGEAIDDDDVDGDEQDDMMQMLGFGGFGSTKGKAVQDNQSSAARGAASKNKGRKYRQYMNRKGGFNRPLDKMN